MKPVKDKPKPDKTPQPSSLERLGAGFFWVLVSVTLAAKVLLLIDNDLEITAKFSDKNWHLNIQPIRKYALVLNNFVDRQFSPIVAIVQQQSDRLMTQTSNILATRRDWCIPVSRLPTISVQTKKANPIFFDDATPDRLVIIPEDRQISPPIQPAPTSLQPSPTVKSVKDWCFTTGTKP
jgi:hypothetical protein